MLTRLLNFAWFRNMMFRILRADNIAIIARQQSDHLICFSPSGAIGRRLYVTGHWHREDVTQAIALLDQHGVLEDGKTALDLGANIGTQTIYLHKTGRFSKVLAVEPEPNNFNLLEMNINLNRLDNATHLIRAAISDTAGRMPLYLNDGYTDGGHSLIARERLTKTVEINTLPISDILGKAGIKPEEISFCWIDTEGYDYECTRQIFAHIGPHVPIFTEISADFKGRQGADDYLAFLNTNYTHCYVFQGGQAPVLFANGTAYMFDDSADLLLFNKSDQT